MSVFNNLKENYRFKTKFTEIIYEYWYFSRRNAQFDKLFYLSQNLLSREHLLSNDAQRIIKQLNERRVNIQKMIGRYNLSLSSVCEECDGKCCKDSIEYYFTAIDYWLRKFTSNPIINFSLSLTKPWFHSIIRIIKNLSLRILRIYPREKDPGLKKDCDCLGNHGCKLSFADRPIKCLVWTCYKLKQAMGEQTKIEYGRLINELYFVSCDTFDILKKEAGISKKYGRLALFLTR